MDEDRPPERSLRDLLKGDDPPSESERNGQPEEEQQLPVSADAWPAWAVVDWEALEGRTGTRRPPSSLPPVDAPRPPVAESAPKDLTDGPEARAVGGPEARVADEPEARVADEPADEPAEAPASRPEVVVRDGAPGSALSLSPQRLWDLVQEAAIAAQEARERASRAEGESEVLRRELDRLREERNALTERLTTRRSWLPWRRNRPSA